MDYEIRAEALTQAIKLAPNNETGNNAQVLEDAQKFYDFLTGSRTAPRPANVRTYRLVADK